MQSLQVLIDQLTRGRNIHISILDLCGILNTAPTQVEFKNIIHSKDFCNVAKSTNNGYRLCTLCKKTSNQKAIDTKTPFSSHCFCGLYEAAYPLIINKNVAAVIYVGNAIVNKDTTVSRIKRVCALSGVDPHLLVKETEKCEFINDPYELMQTAQIVADYLKLLYESITPEPQNEHWLVTLMKKHADEMYCSRITLKELADTYKKNEKYLGRLFKKETGTTFNEYCMELRLHKAELMLLQTESKVIDIAFSCGFDNISYFNRAFKNKFGTSPTLYRKMNG